MPVWSESVPYRWSSQRKRTTSNCACQHIASHCRCCVHTITASNIVGSVDECRCCTCSEWNARENWPNVVHVWCTRPREHQSANRHQDCSDAHDEYWRLGSWLAVAIQLPSLYHLPQERFARDHQHIADTDAEVRESSVACRPPTKPYKHSWIDDERQICLRISMIPRCRPRTVLTIHRVDDQEI